jgi:hypothetical protein
MLAVSDKDLAIFQSSEIDLGNNYTYVYTIPKNEFFHVYGQIDDFLIVTFVNKINGKDVIFCGFVRHEENINILQNEQK